MYTFVYIRIYIYIYVYICIYVCMYVGMYIIYTSTSHSQDFTEGSFAQPCWSKIGKKFLTQMVDAIEKAQAISLERRHDK